MIKEYLGDSVYAQLDEHMDVILTTENGTRDDPSNRIVLDADVLYAFERFIKYIKNEEAK